MTEQFQPTVTTTATPPVKKKRRIFPWVFLAVQALFVVWIITGASSASSHTTQNCGSLSAKACADAAAVGTGIGVMLIIGLWLAVDFILAVSYLIFRVSSRKA